MRVALALGLLVAVYALTLASAHPLDLAAGILIAGALLLALRRFLFGSPSATARDLIGRMLHFPRYALAVVAEVVRGTWTVAVIVIGVRRLTRPGIVAVPIGEMTDTGVAAWALAVTLSPGEVFVDVDWGRRVMFLHVIDASDPDAVRLHHARFYERHQRRVFP